MMQNDTICAATKKDVPAIARLVNSAYRGDSSRQGWTTEADLLDGQRTDEAALLAMIYDPATTLLTLRNAREQLLGCVYLNRKQDSLYLGMLTVSPGLQRQGSGKKLLMAAEEYARQHACNKITMTVISVRHELISWYERHGYHATGGTEPFPENTAFGKPKQVLHFIVLEKKLK